MSKYLVIVESPAKSKTIEKYLGSDYKVIASMGHIRNLANTGKYGLGIDVDNNFEPIIASICMSGITETNEDAEDLIKNYLYE